MNKAEILKAFEKFTEGNPFKLNPDEEHVSTLVDGLLSIEKQSGLKLCPCRLRDGSRETDLSLICPCNFEVQHNWQEHNRCWCGLFVKRK